MKLFYLSLLLVTTLSAAGSQNDVIPIGNNNNLLYYRIGGANEFTLPPVEDTQTIYLNTSADISAGYSCGVFNPALSIANTLNDMKEEADNVEQSVLRNATGSLAEMPLYFLAQANPTAYNLINNSLLSAHHQLDISTRSCQEVKDQIAQGKNPYQDWATLAVNDQWKQHLSLTAIGQEDINTASKTIERTAGDQGIPWVQGENSFVQGTQFAANNLYVGGLNQPPIHVIADTIKAGYNTLLLRDIQNDTPAALNSELANQFPTPLSATAWITNVVGDYTITTCQTSVCKNQQGSIVGRGLWPWLTTCNDQHALDCLQTVRFNLAQLVSGQSPITKDTLQAVSASGVVISPQAIAAIRSMDNAQQSIMVNKLAQEVVMQRIIERALVARHILQAGSQVPIVAANLPAQKIIHHAMQRLDNDIQSFAFEAHIRRQLMSDTLTQLLNYHANQQAQALSVPIVTATPPLLENSAITRQGVNHL